MFEDKIFETKVVLYAMLSDMINIAKEKNENEILPLKDKIIQEKSLDLQYNNSNVIQNNILLRIDVISTFLSKYNDRISQNIIKIYKSVLSSIKLLSKNETDLISNKNQISLLIFSYYIVAHFYFLLTEDIDPLKYFREKIILNLCQILKGGYLIKPVQNIINNTSTEIWMKNKKRADFVDILLNTAKNKNFEKNYNDFINKQNEKTIKKNERKKNKDKKGKIENSEINTNKEESNNKTINLNNKEDEDEKKYNSIENIKDEENEKKTKENLGKNKEENTQNPKEDFIEKLSQKEKEDKFVLKDITLKESKKQYDDKNVNKEIALISNTKREKENMKYENDYPEKEIKEKEDKIQNQNLTIKQTVKIIENADENSIKKKFEKHNDIIKKENTDNEFNKINFAPENETKDKNPYSENIISQINSEDIPNNIKLILINLIENIANLEKDKIDKDIVILNLNEKITNLNEKITNLNKKITNLGKDKKDKDIAIINLSEKINYLREECKNLTDNQIIFAGYLNLLTNGRDISKSIVHFLYKYLKFIPREGEQNYFHLSKIIETLDNNNYNKQEITIDKEILKKFLYLDFFLSKLFNNIIRREIKFKSPEANKKLRLIPEYTFNEKFTNLIFFINNTIKDSDIQIAIQETIDEYTSDSDIFDNIKYKEDNLFTKKNGIYETILKEKDIEDIKKFLLEIKIDNKQFDELCEKKDWKNYGKKGKEENIIKPQFYKGGEKLSDD